jgi:cation:H+ antiporter
MASQKEIFAPEGTTEPASDIRNWLLITLSVVIAVPGLYVRLSGNHLSPQLDSLVFGAAIVGAAFLLSWAAEAAEMDVPRGIALAFLALIAVLPEYAVDMYFAWRAGSDPQYGPYALANMTGGNRLLIGVGWALVVFLFWLRSRKRELEIEPAHGIEIFFLGLATIYAFLLPLKESLSLADSLVFVALFVIYMAVISRAPVEEPELIGPARTIGSLETGRRRVLVVALFLFCAVAIFLAAEPFADGLVHSGQMLGIDEFLLVQWLAPLASESPEMIVAFLFTWRGRALAGIGALISSKVNQWTLLIGTLPIVYSVSIGGPAALHLDARQGEELFLTAAQSAFGIAILANLRISIIEAGLLFVLFISQFFFTDPNTRLWFSAAYIALALLTVVHHRRAILTTGKMLPRLLRTGK